MKKFLSLILAVAMVASMSAVAFAAADPNDSRLNGRVETGSLDKTDPVEELGKMMKQKSNGDLYYDDDDGYPLAPRLIGPFGYNSDDKYLVPDSVEYGKTAYFLLTEVYDSGVPDSLGTVKNAQYRLMNSSDSAKSLKVKGDWEEGKSLVDSLSVTKKKVNGFAFYDDPEDKDDADVITGPFVDDIMKDTYGFEAEKYYYMVALTVEESSSTSDADIIGTLTVSRSKKPKSDIDFDLAVNVDWEQSYRKKESELTITDDTPTLYAETYYALKFDNDSECEFTFADESTFTVDVSGQPKTLVYYDTDFNSKIASKYPLAELNFWNGNGAKFNRTGEFFLSIGDEDYDDYYLYQINSDGTLSEVSGAEYDSSDEGFYFKTRVLGSYVVSDMKLDTKATESTDESDDIVVAPVEPVTPVNPGTGARA